MWFLKGIKQLKWQGHWCWCRSTGHVLTVLCWTLYAFILCPTKCQVFIVMCCCMQSMVVTERSSLIDSEEYRQLPLARAHILSSLGSSGQLSLIFEASHEVCQLSLAAKIYIIRHLYAFWSPFWASWGRRRTLVDGSLESPCRVLVKRNWTSFSICYGWGATRQNVSELAAFRSG